MPNTNCLENIRCPKCGQTESFKIAVTAWATVYDDGTDEFEDVGWNSESGIICTRCEESATLLDFTVEDEEVDG